MNQDDDRLTEHEYLRGEDSTQAKSPVGLVERESTDLGRELVAGDVILDRYEILSRLGRGAMGCVYKVQQLSPRKQVALKTLNPIAASDLNVRRFQNEARAASKLEHPNLVRALDYGWLGNQPFLVMELIEGPTLAQHLKGNVTLPLSAIYQIFIPICFALAYAHKEGVIHRDIKPSNIVLAHADGKELFIPKLVDFGIAKLSSDEQTLTKTGEVFGTPLYMSPEQCLGSKVDNRSDIYSLGCVLYETLTGAPPFTGHSALETMMQHKSRSPLPLKQAALGGEFPAVLQVIVSRMLEKDPDRRYQNCLDVAEDLARLQQGRVDLVKQNLAAVGAEKAKRKIPLSLAGLILMVVSISTGTFFFQNQGKNEATQSKTPVVTTPLVTTSGTRDANLSGATTGSASDAKPAASSAGGAASTSLLPEATAEHYARIVGNERVFDFGHSSIGAISEMNEGDFDQYKPWHECIGKVTFAKDKALLFDTKASWAYEHPNLYHRFYPDDLQGLKIHSLDVDILRAPDIQLDNPLSYASQFSGLKYLNIRNNKVTIAGLENLHIDRMSRLQALVITDTQIDGKKLVQEFPKVVSRLHHLEMGHLKNGPTVLKFLRGSKNIRLLGVEGANLSNFDLTCIATMPNLDNLDLSGNKAVNDKTMTMLSHLTKLRVLNIASTNVTPAYAKQLAKYPHLIEIVVPAEFKQIEKELHLCLPGCKIDFPAPAHQFGQ